MRSLMAEDVLRIEDAWKLALSSTTRVVFSLMAVSPPPMTPPSAIAPRASAITRLEASDKRVVLVVQRAEPLAGLGGADENGVTLEQIGVEGVHGLGQLRHHVIRHIDDVVDRVQSDRREPPLQPVRRRADGWMFSNIKRAVPLVQRPVSSNLNAHRGGAFGQQVVANRVGS